MRGSHATGGSRVEHPGHVFDPYAKRAAGGYGPDGGSHGPRKNSLAAPPHQRTGGARIATSNDDGPLGVQLGGNAHAV